MIVLITFNLKFSRKVESTMKIKYVSVAGAFKIKV